MEQRVTGTVYGMHGDAGVLVDEKGVCHSFKMSEMATVHKRMASPVEKGTALIAHLDESGSVVWFSPLYRPSQEPLPKVVSLISDAVLNTLMLGVFYPVGVIYVVLYAVCHRLGWNDGSALRK